MLVVIPKWFEEIALIIKYLLSLAMPILLAWVTTKHTIKSEIKRAIYKKREEIYFELYDLLLSLSENPYLLYNTEYQNSLRSIRNQLALFASNKLSHEFDPLLNRIYSINESYCSAYESEEAQRIRLGKIEHGDFTEEELNNEERQYQDNNLLEPDYLDEKIRKILNRMREDIGSK